MKSKQGHVTPPLPNSDVIVAEDFHQTSKMLSLAKCSGMKPQRKEAIVIKRHPDLLLEITAHHPRTIDYDP